MVDPEPERTLDDEPAEGPLVVRISKDTMPSKTMPQTGADDEEPGRQLDLPTVPRAVYEAGEEVARGGLGRIYRARDLRLNRVVAIKELINPTRANQRRFLREIQVTVGLEHPNIVAIHEAGCWPDGQPFYSMNFVRGSTLEEAMAACQTLEARLALLPFVVNVADAVAYAHDKGVVHRDLKPANVLVGRFGETVVIDWGLAKMDQPREPSADEEPPQHTRIGAVVGTPPYMPPEQARGELVDARADVYAIGVMLYQLLSGRMPFSDVPPERLLEAIQHQTPAPLSILVPELAPDLLAIIEKAMAPSAADRYQSAREMMDELRRFSAGRLVAAYSYSATDLFLRFVRRHLAAVVTALIATVMLIALVTYGFSTISGERDSAQRHAEDAEEARIRAEARARELIVAEARALADSDPTAAVRRLTELQKPTAGAISVAARAQEFGVAEAVLTDTASQLACAAFSPDGQWIAAAGESHQLLLWSLDGPQASKPYGPAEPRELRGHTERITDCAFSPDGKQLASTGYDGQVILWSLADATQRLLKAPGGVMRALRFSSDGRFLAGVSAEGVARRWRLASGRFDDLAGSSVRRPILAFHVDDTSLLVGPDGGFVRLWVPAEGAEHDFIQSPAEARGATVAAALSADVVLVGTEAGALFEWRLSTSSARKLTEVDGAINAIDVVPNPDAPVVVFATMNGEVFSLSVERGSTERLTRHGERVSSVRLDSSGRRVASGGWDKAVHVVDLDTRAVRVLRGHRDVVSTLAFSPEGLRLVSGSWDNTLRIWPLQQNPYRGRQVLRGHTVGVHGARFSPDGQHVVSGGHDDTVQLWDLAKGTSRVLKGHTDHVFRVVYSHDGEQVASSSDDQTVRVWEVDGPGVRVLSGHRADVEEIAFSPDNRWLLSGSEDATARLWDLEGNEALVLEHDRAVTNVGFSARGGRFATASRGGKAQVYRTPAALGPALSPELVLEFPDEVWALDFGEGGNWFAAADLSGRLEVRQFDAGRTLSLGPIPRAMILRFSPDERQLAVATADGELWLCELSHGRCDPFHSGQGLIHSIAFTPDSRMLFVAGGDALVYGLDLASGEQRIHQGHRAPIFDLDISRDGKRVVSASADETVRLWPVVPLPPVDALPQFLEQLTRPVARAVDEAAPPGE